MKFFGGGGKVAPAKPTTPRTLSQGEKRLLPYQGPGPGKEGWAAAIPRGRSSVSGGGRSGRPSGVQVRDRTALPTAASLLPHDRFSRRHYVVIGFFGAVLCQLGFVGRELFEINYSRCLLR